MFYFKTVGAWMCSVKRRLSKIQRGVRWLNTTGFNLLKFSRVLPHTSVLGYNTAQPIRQQGERGVPPVPPGTCWTAGMETHSLPSTYTIRSSPADWTEISGGNLHQGLPWAFDGASHVSGQKALSAPWRCLPGLCLCHSFKCGYRKTGKYLISDKLTNSHFQPLDL